MTAIVVFHKQQKGTYGFAQRQSFVQTLIDKLVKSSLLFIAKLQEVVLRHIRLIGKAETAAFCHAFGYVFLGKLHITTVFTY